MKNKRNLLLLPLLLLPIVGLTVAFSTFKEVPESETDNLWSILMSVIPAGPMLYCLATVVLVFIFIVTYPKHPHTDKECAATLLFIKVTHLITGAAVYFSARAYMTMRGIEESPYIKTWLLFSFVLSSCFGFFLLLLVAKSTRIRTGWVFLVSMLQFVIVLDVVSGLLLWLRIRKIGSEPEISTEIGAGSETAVSTPAGGETAPVSFRKKRGWRRFRWLLLIPGAYLPYSLIGTFLLMSKLPPPADNPSPLYEMILFAPFIAAVLCNLIYVIIVLNMPDAAEKMTRANMIVRLIQIPGYIINFFFAAAFMITIFTFAISLLLTSFNFVCLLATSFLGAGMVTGAVKDRKMPVRTAFFTSIFSYIYFADAAYAIVLFIYLMVRRISKGSFAQRVLRRQEPENR